MSDKKLKIPIKDDKKIDALFSLLVRNYALQKNIAIQLLGFQALQLGEDGEFLVKDFFERVEKSENEILATLASHYG